jgi:hypothetical protein
MFFLTFDPGIVMTTRYFPILLIKKPILGHSDVCHHQHQAIPRLLQRRSSGGSSSRQTLPYQRQRNFFFGVTVFRQEAGAAYSQKNS